MSDKLSKKVKQSEEIAEAEINSAVTVMHSEGDKQNAWMVLGGLRAVHHIATSLNAQTMKGLQMIRDQKLFEALGFTRFDDFLDNYEHSPMGYKKFNEQEKLFLQEGDAAFDVLSNLRLSIRQRKLLGAGHVQIDRDKGTAIIVTLKDDEEIEEEIPLNDSTRLLQTLSALADQNAVQQGKLNKQRETIRKGETQVDNLQRELDDAKLRGGIMSIEGVHLEHYMRVKNSVDAMTTFVNALPAEEKAKSDVYLNEIQGAFTNLQKAYGLSGAGNNSADESTKARHLKQLQDFSSKKNSVENDEFSAITKDLNDDELAGLID